MRCTQVADQPFPNGEFTCRDWVIAVVIPHKTHRNRNVVVVTHGFPYTMKDRPANIEKLRRHQIILRTWEDEHLFDAYSHYRHFPDDVPLITPFKRFLTRTLYNPVVPLRAEWRRVGESKMEELIAAVKKGLDHDDDIIQQWFDGPDVIKLLTAATCWDEILLAVEAIGGGHEDTRDVAAYVKRVLPGAG
jgi:hypothetical protein